MAPLSIDPSSLNVDERAVLEHVLSTEFVDASQLRSQLDRSEVIAVWGPTP
jgi:polyisoprenoid-binding protein YceI